LTWTEEHNRHKARANITNKKKKMVEKMAVKKTTYTARSTPTADEKNTGVPTLTSFYARPGGGRTDGSSDDKGSRSADTSIERKLPSKPWWSKDMPQRYGLDRVRPSSQRWRLPQTRPPQIDKPAPARVAIRWPPTSDMHGKRESRGCHHAPQWRHLCS
jgi:hypothetical protein